MWVGCDYPDGDLSLSIPPPQATRFARRSMLFATIPAGNPLQGNAVISFDLALRHLHLTPHVLC